MLASKILAILSVVGEEPEKRREKTLVAVV